MTGPARSTLFASCMHIGGDLYPPTSSRVIFAWREHSEVTLAKNNPARAGGGVGGSWRRAQLSQAGLLTPQQPLEQPGGSGFQRAVLQGRRAEDRGSQAVLG